MTEILDKAIRDKISNDFNSNFLVEASAGTGKTTCLVDRITNALLKGLVKPKKLVVITFTNRAADELKSRVLQNLFRKQSECKGKLPDNLNEIIEGMESAEISTIHSFYQRLLSERPLEAGLDADLKVMDEDGPGPDIVWKLYMENEIADFYRKDDLYFAIEAAGISMNYFRNFCFERAKYPELSLSGIPETLSKDKFIEICCSEFKRFTNWAFSSLKKCHNPVNDKYSRQLISIIKSWKNLKTYSPEEKISFISNQKIVKFPKEDGVNWNLTGSVSVGRKECKEAQERMDVIKTFIADNLYSLAGSISEHFMRFFERYKTKTSAITFVDSLVKARDMLKWNKDVRKYFQNKYKMILVDEFQDTDPVQAEVIAWLCSRDTDTDDWRKVKLEPGKLFVVGDPKQSIFRFRRADIRIYEEFKKFFKEDERLILRENFRASEGITESVNAFFSLHIKKRNDFSSPEYQPIHSYRGKGGNTILLNLKMVLQADYDNEKEFFDHGKTERGLKSTHIREREPYLIACWLNNIIKSGSFITGKNKRKLEPGDVMILFRRKAYINDWVRAFQKFELPVENISGEKFFSSREVREAVSLLRAIAYPNDTVSLYSVLKSPLFGISDSEIYSLVKGHGILDYNKKEKVHPAFQLLKKLRKESFIVDDSQKARYIFEKSGMLYFYGEVMKKEQSAAALIKLSSMVEDICINEGLDFSSAIRSIENRPHTSQDLYLEKEKPKAIRLMTIHQAKGLESPMVLLGDMTAFRSSSKQSLISKYIDRDNNKYYQKFIANRMISSRNSKDFEGLPENWETFKEIEKVFIEQEDRRLEYVACTRAEDYLVIPYTERLKPSSYYRRLMDFMKKYPECEKISINYSDYIDKPGVSKEKEIKPYKADIKEYENKIETIKERFNEGLYKRVSPSAKVEEKVPHLKEGYGEEFGTIVHELLERLIYNPHLMEMSLQGEKILSPVIARREATKQSQAEIATSPRDSRNDKKKEDKELINKQLNNAISSNVFKRALNAGEKYSEFSLGIYDEEKKEMVSGSIDLCFKEKDGWVIVDYKTNKIDNPEMQKEFILHYKPQLREYKKTFENITGEKVKETILLFLDNACEIKV